MGCGGSKPDEGGHDSRIPASSPGEAKVDDLAGPLSKEELQSRLLGSGKTETFELGETGFALRYACLSQRGYSPDDLYLPNSDRFVVVPKVCDRSNMILLGVFDGHGLEGDSCAQFVKKNIAEELKKREARDRHNFPKAFQQTFLGLDDQVSSASDFDAGYSGTTAVTAVFRGKEMHIANLGDSRVIMGERRGARIIAYSLSIDQTPYRKDERERIRAGGGVVMTRAMAAGNKQVSEEWEDDLDGTSDPPRVFAPGSRDWPGCPFTRSIGDSLAKKYGINAEAELLKKTIGEKDQFIVLATDGIWEFLTNQAVVDFCSRFDDPLEACHAIVSEAYQIWLQFDVRSDDITLIIAYIDSPEGKAPRMASEEEIETYVAATQSDATGSASGVSTGLSLVNAGGEIRPVRRGMTEEKKQAVAATGGGSAEIDEDDLASHELTKTEKTEAELSRIKASVGGNFLFQHLTPTQAELVYACMRRKFFKVGDQVIKQGDVGEWFYVVDTGEYSVSLEHNGVNVEIMVYRPNPHGVNPCFGELAILYDRPRAATVTCESDGMLWAIDRMSFKKILTQHSAKKLMRTLRSVDILKSLSVGQLQRLSELLAAENFEPGEYVIRQGEMGDTFYIIEEGLAKITKSTAKGREHEAEKEIGEIYTGQYFGERALLKHEARAANVIASGDSTLKVLSISKDSFEVVLGPLQKLIDEENEWRYKVAFVKQLRKNAAGLSNTNLDNFTPWLMSASSKPLHYILARHKGREYTMKAISKPQIVEMDMQARTRLEMELLTSLHGHERWIPLALTTLEDESYIYCIYPTRVSIGLEAIMAEGPLDEEEAQFYIASIACALDHIHQEIKTSGGVVLRHIVPESFVLDENGYLQLLDLRYACKAEPPPRDICGYAHFFAPEQVGGMGHGIAVDFWQLGILLYEMVLCACPWLMGDPSKDSEVAILARIAMHKSGELKFPEDAEGMSEEFIRVLDELLEPRPEDRLGARPPRTGWKYAKDQPGGMIELRDHAWFEGFDWAALQKGELPSPHQDRAYEHTREAVELIESGQNPYPTLGGLLAEIYDGDQSDFHGIMLQSEILPTRRKDKGIKSFTKTVADAVKQMEAEKEVRRNSQAIASAAAVAAASLEAEESFTRVKEAKAAAGGAPMPKRRISEQIGTRGTRPVGNKPRTLISEGLNTSLEVFNSQVDVTPRRLDHGDDFDLPKKVNAEGTGAVLLELDADGNVKEEEKPNFLSSVVETISRRLSETNLDVMQASIAKPSGSSTPSRSPNRSNPSRSGNTTPSNKAVVRL